MKNLNLSLLKVRVNNAHELVGMGATMSVGSDSHAGTVVKVEGNLVTVQEDHAKRTDNNGPYTEAQEFAYTPNPEGRLVTFKQNAKGRFVQVRLKPETGRWVKSECYSLGLGFRREYLDPSF